MRKTLRTILAVSLLVPNFCLAAEKIAPKTLEFLEATTISGYVQSSYQHSWSANGDQNAAAGAANANSSPGVTPGRLFNPTRNSFNIDQVKLTLEKPLDESDFAAGYRVDLLFGETASLIHSTKANGTTFNLGNDGDLEQAYVQFRIPVGTGLDVKFGKFVTLLGNEVIDAPANWNYSRSYLFGYAVPFTHTGALLSYAFMKADDKNPVGLDMQLAVVNGWDNVEDNNSGKSFMGRVGVTLLGGKLVFATMGIGGPEQASNNEDIRWVVNEVITWNATDKLSFALEGLYGEEDFSRAPLANGGESASWWGGAFYAKYQWTPHFSTAGRVEYFKDTDGARLAGTGLTSDPGVHVTAGTLSMQLDQVWKNLTPRLEFRYDKASEPIFGSTADTSIFTVSMDMIYVF